MSAAPAEATGPPMLERRHWRVVLAVLFVFFTPYQTLVQTVTTDDAVRKGVNVDDYDMTWQQVAYGVGVLYGLFTGLGLSARLGARNTIVLGLAGFALGNVLCGAAIGLKTLMLGKFVDGFGKMMALGLCRSTLYKQFSGLLLVAIGLYGTFAYSTRNLTPLLMAELAVGLSWRWMFWFYVPFALIGMVLVYRSFRPDRPAQPVHVKADPLAITLFVAWVVAVTFAFSWYRKWGGWTSNTFAVVVILCLALPVILAVWLGSGLSPDEHLKRLVRTRVFVLAMTTRGLMLLHLVAVLTIVGIYATELRGYPRTTAGWLMAPTALTMATSTILTTVFHRRALRHVWLVVGFVGTAACVWWLSSLDNFTPKEHVALILACWGAFLGLFPPAFLTDEIEGLNPKDFLYAGALAVVGLVTPIITVPTATATVIKAWADRAEDTYRLNLMTNRPAVDEAGQRIADYYIQRGLTGAPLQQEVGTILGGYVKLESLAVGLRLGLRFLSLMMLALGVPVALALWYSAHGLAGTAGGRIRLRSTSVNPGVGSMHALIFDLDGTLVDTVYTHVLAWQGALGEVGIVVAGWQLHRHVGSSGRLITRFAQRETGRTLSPAQEETVHRRHEELFRELLPHPRPLPGAAEAFRLLRDAHIPCAIATASYRPLIDASLDAVGVGPDVIVVEGKGKLQGKPEPDLFLATRKQLGVEAGECIVVGDAVWDHVAARRASMVSVGVLTGGYGEEELYHAGAFRVYRNIADLLRSLDELGIVL